MVKAFVKRKVEMHRGSVLRVGRENLFTLTTSKTALSDGGVKPYILPEQHWRRRKQQSARRRSGTNFDKEEIFFQQWSKTCAETADPCRVSLSLVPFARLPDANDEA